MNYPAQYTRNGRVDLWFEILPEPNEAQIREIIEVADCLSDANDSSEWEDCIKLLYDSEISCGAFGDHDEPLVELSKVFPFFSFELTVTFYPAYVGQKHQAVQKLVIKAGKCKELQLPPVLLRDDRAVC
jgi:hypothetical protein